MTVCIIENCEREANLPGSARGLCRSHYSRWQRHGDPLAGDSTYQGEPMTWLQEHLPPCGDECLLWPFARNRQEYGRISFEGHMRLAHHVALILVGRTPPTPPLETRHLCGVEPCVNPSHLEDGTHAQNMADQLVHGTRRRGEDHWSRKLLERDVLAIRASHDPPPVLARRFEVSLTTIWRLRRGESWEHLLPDSSHGKVVSQ